MRMLGFFALATVPLLVACGSEATAPAGPAGHTAPSSNNPPRPPDVGVQFSPPVRVVMPGEQFYECYFTSLPSDVDIGTRRLASWMTTGSHHLVVYTTNKPTQPDGTFADCPDERVGSREDPPVWLYATQQHESEFRTPSGVAIPLKAHQPLIFNMHYLNTTSSAMNMKVWLNVEYETAAFQKAGSYVTFDTQIAVPPNATQVVSGNCNVPEGAKFFAMSTHSHAHTVYADAVKWRAGQPGDSLVKTTDWAHAAMVRWAVPPYMTFAPGEQLHYECKYMNTTTVTVGVGNSSLTDEMCMAIGYYFPAAEGGTFCEDSTVR